MKKNWITWLKKTSHPDLADKEKVWAEWSKNSGWVYIAKVGSTENLFKIGMTGRENPFLRVKELEMTVSATESFELVWAEFFMNRHEAESDIHEYFKNAGSFRGKEFFEVTLDRAKVALSNIKKAETQQWCGWNVDLFEQTNDFTSWASDAFSFDEWFERQ